MYGMSLKRVRWLAFIYAALIAVIVVMADDGHYRFFFDWFQRTPGADKVGHFMLMGGLAFVVNAALGCKLFPWRGRTWLLGSVIVGVIVTVEEFSQIWIPSRTFDLLDLTSDFLGIFILGRLARKLAARVQPTPVIAPAFGRDA